MAFIVPLRRLGIDTDTLKKALGAGFSRGGTGDPRAAHKYVKRQFIGFKNGKRLYRYWYADDIAKERAAKAAAGTGDEHEHADVKDIGKLFTALAKNRVKPSEVTEATLAKMLGIEDVSVTVKAPFLSDYHSPWLREEREHAARGETYDGNNIPRFPLLRMYRAFEMLPEKMRELLATTLHSVSIGKTDDPEVLKDLGKADHNVLGYHQAGSVWVLGAGRDPNGSGNDSSFNKPTGWPRFGSPATGAEEVLWHELGHALHDAFIKGDAAKKAVWEEWKKLGKGGEGRDEGEALRVSDYAYLNEKEDWAESVACLLSHPKQFAMQCPKRYAFLRKHAIPGPSLEEILRTPDEDLAWWDAKPPTYVGEKLAAMKRSPEGRVTYATAYRSDKDQFYSMMYNGRSIFFRCGPADKEQEKGWIPIPDPIDEVTGLPHFDRDVAQRFRAAEGYKEIYDEHGNPLTVDQALLYLRQNDDDFNDSVRAAIDKSGALEATHLLQYQIYIALGQSTGNIEEERARVAKERGKFDAAKRLKDLAKKLEKTDDAAKRSAIQSEITAIKNGTYEPAEVDRHVFAPHPMSREEFERQTPTFKFDKIGKAEVQPHVQRVYDRATKKMVPRVTVDPVSGKETPLLTITNYEMANPDGTKTVIPVSTAEPFMVGGTMLAPVVITLKKPNGTDYQEQRWVKYRINANGTLTPEDKHVTYSVNKDGKRVRTVQEYKTLQYTGTDPVKLARDLNVSVPHLLKQNGRLAQGQITDPLLASLINPGNSRIRNEGDLAELMRQAAKARATSWTTIKSDEGGDNATYAHVKLTFDGGGNPLLDGSYWNRSLGLSYGNTARVDALLDKEGKLKLEAVREVKPRKVELFEGGPAQYEDPAHPGKWVVGRITSIRDEKDEETGANTGRKVYVVTPIKGQGTALTKRVTLVDKQIRQAMSDVDLTNIRKKRREVEPLKHHVLLYGDSLRIGADGALRGGTVRVKLPADGSISWEEIRRFPAIRTDTKTGELYVSMTDINVLRDVLGGFVMDRYVTQLLAQQAQREQMLKEQSQRADIVTTSQLIAADGGVNNDPQAGGLLAGLRTHTPDGKRFKLGSHQEEFLRFCARSQGRCMAAHFMGTGKTVSAIAAITMMKNGRQKDGSPLPGAPKKKVAIVVPLNTVAQWESAVRFYTNQGVTVVGSSTLPNSVQACNPDKWPPEAKGDTPAARAAAKKYRDEWLKTHPRGWKPDEDENEFVVIPFEYFSKNEADLRLHGGFDGIVVDEAHGFAKESARSSVLDDWNPSMNMMLLLTGTPVTNKLDDLPRYMDLLSNGKSPLGSREEFRARYLIESAVLRARGSKGGAPTDLNPQRAAELGAKLAPYMHVALSEDVKGKTMPAVLLDENQPAHMVGVQEKVYRLAMASMTSDELAKLEEMGAIGADETAVFAGKDGGALKRKVNIARAFANSPGYKPPDDREYVEWIEEVTKEVGKKGETKTVEKAHVLELPGLVRLMGKPPQGFDGKWPGKTALRKGWIKPGEYEAMALHIGNILGVDYEKRLAGKPVSPKILAQIEKGEVNGHKWGKVANPEYGPEGAIARGSIDIEGDHSDIEVEFDGEKIKVPTGLRFIRDPNRKAEGVYYHSDDWDFASKFSVASAEDADEDAEDEEKDEEDEKGEKKPKRGWKPVIDKDGKEQDPSIQRSPLRRRERAMFDAVLTRQNAKCDELERFIHQNVKVETGGKPDTQMIFFGNRVGSSCRTMESKLRTMGYMDINEALGNDDRGYSSEADKQRRPKTGKYFVTYFGKSASLGDRDLNSEIFRKVKNEMGLDTDTSMFVHRTLTGSVGTPPKIDPATGKAPFVEGWTPTERVKVAQMFAGSGKNGELEAPMRVTKRIVGGVEKLMYVYESDLKANVRREVKSLEKQMIGATDLNDKKRFEAALADIFEKHITDRPPLTQRQIDVFNNCQFMVASDAAQVGLNWGNANKLVMYDSLHSPMQEWQRITRAARMLDAVVPDAARPTFAKLDAKLRELEQASAEARLKTLGYDEALLKEMRDKGELSTKTAHAFMEYDGMESALPLIQEAYDSLSEPDKLTLSRMFATRKDAVPGAIDPVVVAEMYYANRAMDRIRELRPKVTQDLRQGGRFLQQVEVPQEDGTVKVVDRKLLSSEITTADVTNEIIENHLTDFEKQILRSRKYLVDVKRLTTSVNMPVFETVKTIDPDTGKAKKIRVPTGEVAPEAPSKAELAQMTQGRAKQVPYEFTMDTIQRGYTLTTSYDHIAATSQSAGSFTATASPAPSKVPPKAKRSTASAPAVPSAPIARTAWQVKRDEANARSLELASARKAKREAKLAAMRPRLEAEKKKRIEAKRLATINEKRRAQGLPPLKPKKTKASVKKSFGFGIPLNTFLFGTHARWEV